MIELNALFTFKQQSGARELFVQLVMTPSIFGSTLLVGSRGGPVSFLFRFWIDTCGLRL
jgi:hypothetical protein